LFGRDHHFIKKRIYGATVSQRLRNTNLSMQLQLSVTISTQHGMHNQHVKVKSCKYLVMTSCNTVKAPLCNIQKLCVKVSDWGETHYLVSDQRNLESVSRHYCAINKKIISQRKSEASRTLKC